MSTYAKTTDVPVEKSQDEIRQTLKRYGATMFGVVMDDDAGISAIQFRLQGRDVRLHVTVPTEVTPKMVQTARDARRSRQPEEVLAQTMRQRWRALNLYVLAACEAIENDAMTIEQAFMFGVVLPNNRTVGDWATEQLQYAVDTGRMPPPLLPAPA